MMVTASAPGKLFILGEHAVVYGYPCLVAAIDKRIYVTSQIVDGNGDQFITPGVTDLRFVSESVKEFKKNFSLSSAIQITTKSDFSDKVGFGSSAGVTVATISSLNALFDCKLSKIEIFNISYDVVTKIQRIASGADIAASVYGGIAYYQKKETPLIKQCSNNISLIVGYSGAKADTVLMVKKVAKMHTEKKEFVEKIFIDIAKLVEDGYKFLQKMEYEEFGKCMNKNHLLLQKLAVSTTKLDQMVRAALDAGAWGAKLSGAGGGDCIIAIGPLHKRKIIEEAIQKVGGQIIDVTISTDGVKII